MPSSLQAGILDSSSQGFQAISSHPRPSSCWDGRGQLAAARRVSTLDGPGLQTAQTLALTEGPRNVRPVAVPAVHLLLETLVSWKRRLLIFLLHSLGGGSVGQPGFTATPIHVPGSHETPALWKVRSPGGEPAVGLI